MADDRDVDMVGTIAWQSTWWCRCHPQVGHHRPYKAQARFLGWDPNGTKWASDTSRFGYKMLAKMGWSDGKGLGVNEQGDTTFVKQEKRFENLGVYPVTWGRGRTCTACPLSMSMLLCVGIGADLELAKNNYVETSASFSDLLKRLNSTDKLASEGGDDGKHKKHKHKHRKREADADAEEVADDGERKHKHKHEEEEAKSAAEADANDDEQQQDAAVDRKHKNKNKHKHKHKEESDDDDEPKTQAADKPAEDKSPKKYMYGLTFVCIDMQSLG